MTDSTKIPNETQRAREGDPSKPVGEAGTVMLKRMNDSHRPLREWGFAHIDWKPGMRILDIGCGGGAAIREMLDLSEDSVISGVDYQMASVDLTRETNAEFLGSRVDVSQADAGDLPFEDETFDLVTAVETVYFWPDLPGALEEIYRVLKPEGSVAILNDGSDPDTLDWPEVGTELRIYRPGELADLLEEAGFSDVTYDVGEDGQMLVGIGTK